MLLKGFALNTAVVHTTKTLVDKWRPTAQNPDSFPSDHTAAAFGGASFIQTRYGYSYGIPAYALASFVGDTVNFDAYAEIDVGGAGDEYMLDATLQYRYKMSKHWGLGGGYRY